MLIWSAYSAIPCVILFFIFRRKDTPFPRIFWLFAAFIFFCGTTHLLEAVIFWEPVYRLSALFKAITAVVSWVTVFGLIKVMPTALSYPGLAEMNRELEQSNRDLNAFASVVSHDLKAPLRGIQALADWIGEDEAELSDKSREHLELIESRTRRMQLLIDGVLRYSRAGTRKFEMADVDTDEVVQSILDDINLNPSIRVEKSGRLPVIRFDAVMFQQIMQNLIANAAASFDEPGGTIEIACRGEDDMWVYDVADNGRGIPPERQKDVFEMFHSYQSGKKADAPSAGIGLAIVKRIAERFGGMVELASEPGKGSRFTIRIPMKPF